MALPEGIKSRNREDWLAIASQKEIMDRKPVIEALKGLGVDPVEYMQWGPERRVEFIMEAQKGSNGSNGGGGDEEKKSSKGKASASVESAPSSGGGGSKDVSALKSEVAGLREDVAALTALVKDAHFLIRILVQSNSDLAANAKDDDLQEAIYGKLAVKRGNA